MKTYPIILAVLLAATFPRAAEYHVSKNGNDGNNGSEANSFKTISAAARIARPGDVITVHEGVYRERVNPPRGGESDARRIVYRAAPGEDVVIKGSETIKGWEKVRVGVWKVTLPNHFFGDYNPYNDVIGGEWYNTPRDGFNRHTGAVYLDGHWLDEAKTLEHVVPPSGLRSGSEDLVLGGRTAAYAGRAIAGTEEDVIYQTCRYDLGGYRLAVPDGTYRVTLKFCEPHFDTRNKRVFDVYIQGKAVLRNFDVFAKIGKFAAHDESFDGIDVTGGQLKIDIVNRVSMAFISGIVVEHENFSKKINCGGPEWKGYQRDPAPAERVAHPGRPLWYARVDGESTVIWAQFKDVDPNRENVEINVRQSVFYPDRPGRNYITVRGFTMRHAATPWSGAMSEQIGLVGTHWSRGWIIENNVISHSMNTGITLGRYALNAPLPAATAPGFVRSIELALENGWSRDKIGGHVVRDNQISHCEKNGIHGSLGGIFSTIEGNVIHDIAVRGWISGPDVAGLKLLGSHDTLIRNNHIYRCRAVGGIWLDWMAQGTRVTGNLLHDNSQDLFMEVNHGPFLIDHNLFLSSTSLRDWSQGGAYAHNLFAGTIGGRTERRKTPYFKAHTVQDIKLSNIQHRDLRFHNNLFLGSGGLSALEAKAEHIQAVGNVYLSSAKPGKRDRDALVAADFDPGLRLEESPDGWRLEMAVDPVWISKQKRAVITTELLGRAKIPDAPFEQPDETPYRLDRDFLGKKRNTANPAPGPFQFSASHVIRSKVWPCTSSVTSGK